MQLSISESMITRGFLVKDIRSDTRMYAQDSSSLFSMKAGSVGFRMSLPSKIRSGKYSRCINGVYFSDFLLFSVNPSRYYFIQPGIYAALTVNGIEFSVWTREGKYSVVDNKTNVNPNEMHTYEFCWDWSAKLLGSGAKAAIFVDGECTAASNVPIGGLDSLSNIEFTAFDNEWMDYQNECTIADVFTYSSVPMHLRGEVGQLSSVYLGTGYVALSRRSDFVLWNKSWSDQVVTYDRGTTLNTDFSMASCDTSGDIYIISSRGISGYGSVSMYSQHDGVIDKSLSSIPKCIAVTQLDGIDFPKIYEEQIRRCEKVWVADGSKIIQFDHFLNEVMSKSGFSDISCIVPLSNGKVWVFDNAANKVYLLSELDLSIEGEISVDGPYSGGATIDGKLYIYSKDDSKLMLYEAFSKIKTINSLNNIAKIDVEPNEGSVFIFYSDGVVKWLDWKLRLKSEWSVCENISFASIRRGYNRKTVIVVDRNSMTMYEVTYEGNIVKSCSIPPGQYTGSMAVPAANVGSFVSVANASADVMAGVSVVSNVSVNQYTVDRLLVDLSGGKENDFDGNGETTSGPTDLPFGVYKGTRLPE